MILQRLVLPLDKFFTIKSSIKSYPMSTLQSKPKNFGDLTIIILVVLGLLILLGAFVLGPIMAF